MKKQLTREQVEDKMFREADRIQESIIGSEVADAIETLQQALNAKMIKINMQQEFAVNVEVPDGAAGQIEISVHILHWQRRIKP